MTDYFIAVFDNGHLKDDLENGQMMIDALLHEMRCNDKSTAPPMQSPLVDVHNSVWERIVKVYSLAPLSS